MELFRRSALITGRDVAALFGISERAARNLLTAWVEKGFVVVADPAKKSRKYGLSSEFAGGPGHSSPCYTNLSEHDHAPFKMDFFKKPANHPKPKRCTMSAEANIGVDW